MHLGALSVLAIPLLLTPMATGAPQEHPATAAYHEDCVATPRIVYSAKTKQTVETYTADCTVKYIVPGKETRLVWGGPLVLPTNASRLDALIEIDRWMKDDAKKIVDADLHRKRKKEDK